MQHLSPAEFVIMKFGGVNATARAIGRDPGAVSKWRQPKEKRGTAGRIPSLAQVLILAASKRAGLDITAQDLVSGRSVRTKSVRTSVPVV